MSDQGLVLADDPLDLAERLAGVYGRGVELPLMYPQGVALSGRLRLARLTDSVEPVAAEVARIVAPLLADAAGTFDRRFGLPGWTGAVWAEELFEETGDERYRQFLLDVAAEFDLESQTSTAPPLDPDVRVEDFFFAGALLGRAFKMTGDARYADLLAGYLRSVDTQQEDGLFWHCHASPFYWGRGNAFAALGFAEALTYLPADHPLRPALLDSHLTHLQALGRYQHESGMWHQLIDDRQTYLEHSATTMLTTTIARGIDRGWLPADPWGGVVAKAWRGIVLRTGPGAELEHVCVGTGPLADRGAYVDRSCTDGTDDRGGAMALWCAVEVERLRRAG